MRSSLFSDPRVPQPFDPNDKRVSSIVRPFPESLPEGEARADVGLVGVPHDTSILTRRGAAYGPELIRRKLFASQTYAPSIDTDIDTTTVWDFGDIRIAPTDVSESHDRIRQGIRHVVSHSKAICVIGGDHGITFPVIQGLTDVKDGPFGLIVFDAHHDVREIHYGTISSGTPFRRVFQLPGTPIQPCRTVQIGIADWRNSPVYTRYCRDLGVHVIPARTVHQKGIIAATEQAIAIASEGTRGFFVSFDMDVFDIPFSPGVSAHVPGGLWPAQGIEAVLLCASQDHCLGMDLVETSPALDVQEWTSELAATLLLYFLAGRTIVAKKATTAGGDFR